MELFLGFVISVILGLLGLLPALIFKRIVKGKVYSKNKAALIMIPVATLSVMLITMILAMCGVEVNEFSFITLFIIAGGTFDILRSNFLFRQK